MKNIFKTTLLAIAALGIWSCEEEQDLYFLSQPASFEIVTPESGTAIVLTQELMSNPALTISWDDTDYGTPTAVNYTVQAALEGTNFETPVSVASTTNTTITFSVEELNNIANGLGLAPFTAAGMDVRIRASVGTTVSQEMYSNVVTIIVTPFSTDIPLLWMVGGFQGDSGYGSDWTHSTAPTLKAEGVTSSKFEGYVYIATDQFFSSANDSRGFKLTDQDNWSGNNYGDDESGNFNTLSTSGVNISVAAGYYRVNADTGLLNYSLTNTNWGIIGSATGSWDVSTPMIYNPTSKKWEITMRLEEGAIKFRANNSWDVNFGDDGADGTLEYGSADISVAVGNYLIQLDLSNPREYSYTLTPQ